MLLVTLHVMFGCHSVATESVRIATFGSGIAETKPLGRNDSLGTDSDKKDWVRRKFALFS